MPYISGFIQEERERRERESGSDLRTYVYKQASNPLTWI
jgi:hypothetical protein